MVGFEEGPPRGELPAGGRAGLFGGKPRSKVNCCSPMKKASNGGLRPRSRDRRRMQRVLRAAPTSWPRAVAYY
eukprot:3813590-Prymnesium_polylepis.1